MEAAAGDSNAAATADTSTGAGWQPGKARDLFASVDGVTPLTFTGFRMHVQYKNAWLASMVKFNSWGYGPNTLWSSLRSDLQLQGGRMSAMYELDPFSGNWNYELFGRSDGRRKIDASVQVQVAARRRLTRARLDVDFACPGKIASLSVDPILKECAFQYLQAINVECCRLAVGCELAFKGGCDRDGSVTIACRPAVMVKYAGPDYLVSGKLNAVTKSVRLAYYQHCSDALQTGVTVTLDPARPAAVTRVAFRLRSDATQFLAAVGTDGVMNGLWERRLGNRTAVSVSAFRNFWIDVFGLGVGLSFDF